MDIKPSFPTIANSPVTKIMVAITDFNDSIQVEDARVLPYNEDVGGIASIFGSDDGRLFGPSETIHFTSISGNVLNGVTRGYGGTNAQIWKVGSIIARVWTNVDAENADHNTKEIVDAVLGLKEDVDNIGSVSDSIGLAQDVLFGYTSNVSFSGEDVVLMDDIYDLSVSENVIIKN